MFTSPTSYDATVAQDTRRRRADAERNIEAILDAALRLFTASTNVSMTDIAHAAGVGRVTLYAHFPSREDLVDAVVERSLAESAELIQVDGFDTAPADEVLVRLVRTSWQALHRHRRIRLVAQAELGEQRLKARHERAEVAARLHRLIARVRTTARSARTFPSVGWSPRSSASCTPRPTRWMPVGSRPMMHPRSSRPP